MESVNVENKAPAQRGLENGKVHSEKNNVLEQKKYFFDCEGCSQKNFRLFCRSRNSRNPTETWTRARSDERPLITVSTRYCYAIS